MLQMNTLPKLHQYMLSNKNDKAKNYVAGLDNKTIRHLINNNSTTIGKGLGNSFVYLIQQHDITFVAKVYHYNTKKEFDDPNNKNNVEIYFYERWLQNGTNNYFRFLLSTYSKHIEHDDISIFNKYYQTKILFFDYGIRSFGNFIDIYVYEIGSRMMQTLLFQLAYLLYCLDRDFLFMHNDIHFGNIMIDVDENYVMDVRKYYRYKVEDKFYYVPVSPFIIKLYDFDRSHMCSIFRRGFSDNNDDNDGGDNSDDNDDNNDGNKTNDGDKNNGGNIPFGDKPFGDKPFGDKPFGNISFGIYSYGIKDFMTLICLLVGIGNRFNNILKTIITSIINKISPGSPFASTTFELFRQKMKNRHIINSFCNLYSDIMTYPELISKSFENYIVEQQNPIEIDDTHFKCTQKDILQFNEIELKNLTKKLTNSFQTYNLPCYANIKNEYQFDSHENYTKFLDYSSHTTSIANVIKFKNKCKKCYKEINEDLLHLKYIYSTLKVLDSSLLHQRKYDPEFITQIFNNIIKCSSLAILKKKFNHNTIEYYNQNIDDKFGNGRKYIIYYKILLKGDAQISKFMEEIDGLPPLDDDSNNQLYSFLDSLRYRNIIKMMKRYEAYKDLNIYHFPFISYVRIFCCFILILNFIRLEYYPFSKTALQSRQIM